ncbi:methyltransferase domain-containing protein [Yinghuangia seranimata]|uniref:methyltransferase domain-containing protein n=1 Tax=Yinghuangia seranimata TaxID=408067 RepID=UPI00248AC49C|nr:methyltransferase domain-containing protein [Yinghuangia seranimata]MDI2129659.1 methyltransferase domain-containing protein [Yinghuangia seranimata]
MNAATPPSEPDPAALRAELARRLAVAGHVPDPGWERVMAELPREVFLPEAYVRRSAPPGWLTLHGGGPDTRADWLRLVNSGDSVVVELDGTGPDAAVRVATVPMPRYLAALHALAPKPGMRVLELGLGTGLGAGMIDRYLRPWHTGDPEIVAVEIDPAHAAAATERLASLGARVRVVTADAFAPELPRLLGGAFDRIITTFPVDDVPPIWRELLAPGGRLVTFLGPELHVVEA